MKAAVVTGENVTSDWELIPHTGYSRGWQGVWQLFLRPLKQEVSLTFPSCFSDNYSRQSLHCHCCSSRNAWLWNTRLNIGKEIKKDKKHPLSQYIHQRTAVCRERTDWTFNLHIGAQFYIFYHTSRGNNVYFKSRGHFWWQAFRAPKSALKKIEPFTLS